MRDYSRQVLSGEGDNDYARYMRTDALLSLQRRPEEMVHRDELLFQIVHQSTELWLKLACSEIREATARIQDGELDGATTLLARASLAMELVTSQLEMMRHLSPWDFQTIRTVLGHGSGADSPGWLSVRRDTRTLGRTFAALVEERGIDLDGMYRAERKDEIYRLAEALIEWDERVSLWRVRHYKVAARVIGHQVTGTQGTPVETLTKLIAHRFFPELWQIRTHLTETGPMADPYTDSVQGGSL
ncbi:tryptophan 2,3-dioxygenase [Nocardia amamiensis]|uniref:Tryptophan 2,3-dioxygenase n=1 Tax=Nocardia amamiensis TaxID=404578 RepID=A0ABS0D1V5_9NOCA|nr:tryptophan 2,3-dioxygenase family protein [Nocardia amamiensis]MBF6302830.1 tryptophan 2,3-dioxygenase [Nocardia amamiensis]